MNTLKILSLVFVSVLALASCSKDDTAPVITITSPTEGAVLLKGSTYPVIGTVTDDEELAEIEAGGVKITTFDSKTKHVIANINLPIPATAASGSASFTVNATDKEGNKSTKVVTFTVQ
ncbi:MAG: hypothetical protein IPN86_21430 [Saprospiraceae bacterium]|jgi:hypothetical protein|nr:hypothetical protein [Saprospiraceae bacterium]